MIHCIRPRHLLVVALFVSALALSGCVAYPAGYYGGPSYGYAGPPVAVGVGGWWGWHHDDDDWGDHDWHGGWGR